MMTLKCILSAALLIAGLTAFSAGTSQPVRTALADQISDFLKGEKDSAAAVKKLKAMSAKNGRAAALLGLCCKEGYGMPVSLSAARTHFLNAAKLGDAVGQFWGGFFLLKGIGGSADIPKAVDMLESSAVQGISNAMLLLAHVYLEGYSRNGILVIREDHPLAVRYLRRAAAGGNKEAALALGDWYFRGGMINNDPIQAREWFVLSQHRHSKAAIAEVDYECGKDDAVKAMGWKDLVTLAESSNPRAEVYTGTVYLKQGDVARASALANSAAQKGYAPAVTLQALIAKQQGKKWIDIMLKAVAAGDPEALAHAGFEMANSRGRDAFRGVEMLERAARRGVVNGLVKMGRVYLRGGLVPKDEHRAFNYFRKSAEKGNLEAKYYLSLCYRDGLGCRVNYATAAQCAFEAAEAGDSYAQTLYATYLRDGLGVKRDTNKALAYLQKAVAQGNKHAQGLLSDLVSKAEDISSSAIGGGLELVQKAAIDGDAISAYSLGRIYTEGSKVKRDFVQGRKNYELAIRRKHPDAYAALAEYYINGWGVSKDYKKAHQLIEQGKKLRSSNAYVVSALCKLNGVGVRKDVRGALQEFHKAADMRNGTAYLWLGICYSKKEYGVAVNEKTACNYFRRAAERGNSAGMLMLALCLRDGIGEPKNSKMSHFYLNRAAAAGNSDALYELGLAYANGLYGDKNMEKAVECYRAAAEKGNSYGVYELGCCYENGRGVEKDVVKAAALYRIAATAGNRYAQFMIARCYEGGIGVPQDKYTAIQWYKKAAKGGFKYAATRAAELQKALESITL